MTYKMTKLTDAVHNTQKQKQETLSFMKNNVRVKIGNNTFIIMSWEFFLSLCIMKETDMMFQYYIEVFLPVSGTTTTELGRLFLVILLDKITYLFYFGLN